MTVGQGVTAAHVDHAAADYSHCRSELHVKVPFESTLVKIASEQKSLTPAPANVLLLVASARSSCHRDADVVWEARFKALPSRAAVIKMCHRVRAVSPALLLMLLFPC
jgi:hypothetical protein